MARRRGFFGFFRMPSIPDLGLEPDTKKSIFIIFIMALGVISLLGLYGGAGQLGNWLKYYLQLGFGWGSPFFPSALIVWGYFLYREERYEVRGSNYLGAALFLLSLLTLFWLVIEPRQWPLALARGQGGGYVGLVMADNLYRYSGLLAGWIISLGLLIVSLLLLFKAGLRHLIGRESMTAKIFYPLTFFINIIAGIRRRAGKVRTEEGVIEDEDEESTLVESAADKEEEELEKEEEGEEEEEEPMLVKATGEDEGEDSDTPVFTRSEITGEDADNWWKNKSGIKINLPLDLLARQGGRPKTGDIEANKEMIRRTMENFGIPVEMGEVNIGPTVTQYTFKPAEGIKLAKIAILGNDLALALALHPIRIEAPIPNRSLVGVEVPNKSKAIVSLREVLESDAYKSRSSNLMIALGKDVRAVNRMDNLGRMPHFLVAGATNTGKSVCLNSIIVSLMYQNDPDDLKLILVDPKRVELSLYNGIPYLLTPVITGVKETINALKWCLNEMDRRFDILKDKSVKNITTYNEKYRVKMPYIVFIIDELADLMVAAGRDMEAGVIRLSQMARAVGIHLILATQRPSVDIITGIIKANMPARAAFTVASGVDSKTILDNYGAEKLLGRGDMLFKNAEMSKPVRIQGTYISEGEIKKIVRYIKDRSGSFEYISGITDKQTVHGLGGVGLDKSGDTSDDLYEEAKEMVIISGKASTTYLQRKLRIGYSRAAGLLDALEEAGVVSAPIGNNKGREVLVTREQYEAMTGMGISGVALHRQIEVKAPEEYLSDEDEDENGDAEEAEASEEGEETECSGEDEAASEEEAEEEIEGNESGNKEEPVKDENGNNDGQEDINKDNDVKADNEADTADDESSKIFDIKAEDGKVKNAKKPIEHFEDKLFSR